MKETVLITGANRGIGLELTRQFAADGWRVLACCRRPEEAEALKEISGEISLHRLDVGDAGQVDELARSLRDERIDILLNNAGIFGPKAQDFGPIDPEGWLDTFRVNVLGPYQMALAFVEQVARSRRKIIAAVGSLMGSLTDNRSGGHYAYRTSKSAVAMVVRSLAADLRPRGITAVVLHPGWVQTDMGGSQAPVTPRESAAGLKRVLCDLRPEDSGRFFNYDGTEKPW